MSCATFRARHLAWLDGDLSAASARALRAHADACATCRRYDAAVRRALILTRHHEPLRVSRGFRAALTARLAESAAGTTAAAIAGAPASSGSAAATPAILSLYGSGDVQGVQGSAGVRELRPGLRLSRCG